MENLNISDNDGEIFSASDKTDASNLSELFDNGLALFTSILETKEATNSFKVQVRCRTMNTVGNFATLLQLL